MLKRIKGRRVIVDIMCEDGKKVLVTPTAYRYGLLERMPVITSNSLNAAAAPMLHDSPADAGGDNLLSEINSISRASAPPPAANHADDLLGLMDSGASSNFPSTTTNGTGQMKGGANLLGDLLGDSGRGVELE